jgi:membrane-bound lytic murein transglycosylase D
MKPILAYLLLFTTIVFSQEKTSRNINNKDITTENNILITGNELQKDSAQLVNHKEATLIDSLWLNNIYNSPLYDDFEFVNPDEDITDTVYNELSKETLKERLTYLNSKTPFNVAYNPSLERLIKFYLKTRKDRLAVLLGKASYYFPLFEEYLDKYDLPLEIKYLAIVESALRPRARSRVGASGLWQFMYYTGKQFDLKVSSYVDERYDPIRATEAACKYLSSLYTIFGDWDLALAAYNSGPGNVSKAIRRSGGSKNYWNIRRYLPRETAGYLPAFYATYYIMEYAKEHNIMPDKKYTNRFETDTIIVKRQISFEQVNMVLNTNDELLEFLNPQYKLNIIPFIKGKNYTLRLPKKLLGKFVSNEEQIYAFAAAEDAKREKPLPKYFESPQRIRYRVRKGDYLGRIAKRFGVSVSQIKRWNGLRTSRLSIGQRLTIHPRKFASVQKKKSSSRVSKTNKINILKDNYTMYIVQKGDSLWLISKKFPKVSVDQIKNWNNIWSVKSLKPGQKLKIYKS